MSIPKLNAYGLLPPGIHEASMAEVEQRFGVGPKRAYLVEQGLKPVVQELMQMGITELYLDGSFTTDKVSPGDVDGYVIASVRSEICQKVIERQEFWRTQYQVDIGLAAEDLEGDLAFWEDWFGHTKGELPRERGILRLALRR
jgi:hypothetical protein